MNINSNILTILSSPSQLDKSRAFQLMNKNKTRGLQLRLGISWDQFRVIWDHHLGVIWDTLGVIWDQLGMIWDHLGIIWDHLGDTWCHLVVILVVSDRQSKFLLG